jgi:anti-sigma factor RsiW
MDCKTFTNRHASFIDDTLPGYQMAAMRDHLTACARCSRRDTEVRRALLLVKNLPAVQVSEGFHDRLHARISAEGPAFPDPPVRDFGFMKWAAAGAMLIAIVGVRSWPEQGGHSSVPTRLPAVFASAPATYDSGDESAPAYFASMSTGIPMWPALMLAEEGPLRFAGMQNASWDGSRPHD